MLHSARDRARTPATGLTTKRARPWWRGTAPAAAWRICWPPGPTCCNTRDLGWTTSATAWKAGPASASSAPWRGRGALCGREYQAAHRLWREVAPLDPDNPELLKKLERSRKVLDNLRSLEE
ncbi:hypothetical protein HML84_09740 [Alcanivorax sp. IO_7]|nr:hypothetical protein HML84_09740 [Alcanivorax sp. IO_7]